MPDQPTLDGYVEWAQLILSARFDAWERMIYTTNAQAILNAANNHEFFRESRSILSAATRDFETDTGSPLLDVGPGLEPSIQLKCKGFDSAVEKSYRLNILRNKTFPQPPTSGWVTPPVWYTQLNDVVRATLVCRYLDGLPWLANRLRDEAARRGLSVVFNSEQRDEGYYAFHVYVTLVAVRLQYREQDGSVSERPFDVSVEIQLTTQLQDALREVTHSFYEERRVRGLTADWKWKHDAPQFRASYISHSLHLLDAIIVELRNGVAHGRRPPPASSPGPQLASSEHDATDSEVAQSPLTDPQDMAPVAFDRNGASK